MALATLLANKAVERSLSHKLEDARDAVINKMVEILTTYKSSMTAAGAGASAQLSVSENLKMLPVLLLGLLKNVRLIFTIWLPLQSPIYMFLIGRNPAKRSNSSGPEGVRTGSFNITSSPASGPVHLPELLFFAQHATRGQYSFTR